MTPIAADAEYRGLLDYAARIGADRSLVQAAGGNVSLKRNGILWVKASGTWLAQAHTREIMVPVRLDPLLAAVHAAGDAAEQAQDFVAQELNVAGLRPSIETTMHAVLPHPVVVHVHCIETIAWATSANAEIGLAERLAGLGWAFVPYVRPGLPLTRSILARAPAGTDVLVLGNHGLVVGANDTASAAALIAGVVNRLRRPVREPPAFALDRLDRIAQDTIYSPAGDRRLHAIGADPESLAVARCGSLYPDHVIFLGPGIVEMNEVPIRSTAPMLVLPTLGVLLRRDALESVRALARCLADVTARLSPADLPVALSAADEAALLGWDAEHYRQSLQP